MNAAAKNTKERINTKTEPPNPIIIIVHGSVAVAPASAARVAPGAVVAGSLLETPVAAVAVVPGEVAAPLPAPTAPQTLERPIAFIIPKDNH